MTINPHRTHRPAWIDGNSDLPDIEYEVEQITDEDYEEVSSDAQV